MRSLKLAVLGIPAVQHRGQELAFPTRKALGLLVYLAVEGGRQPREKLAALFWPESNGPRARTALRTTLNFLKRGLNDPRGAGAYLAAERESIYFDFAADAELDLHKIQSAVQATRELPILPATASAPHIRSLLIQLQSAAALARGEFMEGFSLSNAPDFDGWASLQREVWHRKIGLVFDSLSQLQSESGEMVGALDTAIRWVSHDPMDEAAHRRRMACHLALGDRGAALEAYAACRAILARELQAEPSPETESLAGRIRRTMPARRKLAMRTETQRVSPGLAFETTLVGREVEHVELVAAYHAAAAGRPQVVWLEGEPGIGKTRLAQEFLAWAAAQGAELWHGRAIETSAPLPYQPFTDALRERLDGDPDWRPPLAGVWLAELARLLPELAQRRPEPASPGEPPADSPAEAQTRLFEAVARLGQAESEQAPLVLFIDDLQWADAASLDLLAYVVRRWAAMRVPALLVLAARSESMAQLEPWLEGLARAGPVIRLHLDPLTINDTRELMRLLGLGSLANSGAVALDQFLFSSTGGQPFYLIETLRSLVEQGVLQHQPGGGWLSAQAAAVPMPPGMQSMIRARLARLSPAARALCAAGAVLGSRVEYRWLCRVLELGEVEALPALEELLARGIWREAGAIEFTHDKLREVAYAETGQTRRRVLHKRLFEALAAETPPRAAPAEMAHHALAAGMVDQAYQWSVTAGDAAMRVFAARSAAAHYTAARSLVEQVTLEPAEQHHLLDQLGRAHELTGEWNEAQAVYQDKLGLARTGRQPAQECAALNRLALVMAQGFFAVPRAFEYLREAAQLAERLNDAYWMAETEWALAGLELYTGRLPKRMLAHAERAVLLAGQLNRQDLVARGQNAMAYALMMAGEWPTAVERALAAHLLYQQQGNRAMEADSLSVAALAQVQTGQAQAALATAREALAITRAIENSWGQVNSAKEVAVALVEVGEFSEAIVVAEEALAMARTYGHTWLIVPTLSILGRARRELGQWEEATRAHLEARSASAAMNHPYVTELVCCDLCADYALAGDWDAARQYALSALAIRSSDRGYPGYTRWLETEALLRGGDAEQADQDVRRFGEQLEQRRGPTRLRLQYLRATAVLAAWRGAVGEAIVNLLAAATITDELALPGEAWPIYAALAEYYEQQNDPERAGEAYRRAAEVARSLADHIPDLRQRERFLSVRIAGGIPKGGQGAAVLS